MDLNLSTVIQIGGAVASLFAAYTAVSTKLTILELKLWVSENFVKRDESPKS
jgi:hypothetical protein